MTPTLEDLTVRTGRSPSELTRRDVALALLAVPASDALAALPALRRDLAGVAARLSAAFWDSAQRLLQAIAEELDWADTSTIPTVGQVRRWLEATGTEPAELLPEGFIWPDASERGPTAERLHAQLVTHLEHLVDAGVVDPERMLAGDRAALTAYEQAQLEWLRTPLPDGLEPMEAITDEEADQFIAAWDAADADALAILREELAAVGPRPCPEADLHAACRRLRNQLRHGGWPYDLLRAAGGLDIRAVPSDDAELWLTLGAGVVVCQDEPPEEAGAEVYAAWMALDHSDWIGAIATLAGSGPGARADADSLARYAITFDFEHAGDADPLAGDDALFDEDAFFDDDPLDEDPFDEGPFDDDDLGALQMGFDTVALLWTLLEAVDADERLTPLGWWGLPEAALRAWDGEPG